MKPKLTNGEASAKLARKSRDALFKGINADWIAAKKAADEGAKLELMAVNRLRSAGLKLQQASDHEQVNFTFYDNHRSQLPEGMTFKAVKFCIHLARAFAAPIKTLDEARKARQLMFEAFGQASAPKRIEDQASHESNPWSEFVAGAANFTGLFRKIEAEPMEQWGLAKLNKFVETTKPIVDKHQAAKELLAA